MIDIDSLKRELASEPAKPARRTQTNIGIMRELYDEISHKHENGWRAADLVEWLAAKGVVLSENCFRNYLYQIDRERGRSRIMERVQGKGARDEQHAQPAPAKVTAAAKQAGASGSGATPQPAKSAPTAEPARQKSEDEFPTSEERKPQAEGTAGEEDGDLNWDNLASQLKVEKLDEKGFVRMPGEGKK